VYSPAFSEQCGGCQVLHYLVDRINVLFTDDVCSPVAVIAPFNHDHTFFTLNSRYWTPISKSQRFDGPRFVAIYPEIIPINSNPLHSSHIVHWILYFPGINGGSSELEFSAQNFTNSVACFSTGFCKSISKHVSTFPLRLVDYEFYRFWQPPNPSAIKIHAWVLRKKNSWVDMRGSRIAVDSHVEISRGVEFPHDVSKATRIELYRRAVYFYSFDAATFLNVEAALAGCISVVVPVPGVSRSDWLESAGPEFKYGIAYGETDIPHAIQTLPLLLPHLKALSFRMQSDLVLFVFKLQQRWYSNSSYVR
jgi:hypothetical protein